MSCGKIAVPRERASSYMPVSTALLNAARCDEDNNNGCVVVVGDAVDVDADVDVDVVAVAVVL